MNNGHLVKASEKLYTIEEVHALFKKWQEQGVFKPNPAKRKKYFYDEFDGFPVKTYSQRYALFLTSTKCSACGLEANCYRLEKSPESKSYHFNLYYIDGDKEVLFTKDHIIPASKGGRSTLSNYQTMCSPCNWKKGPRV